MSPSLGMGPPCSPAAYLAAGNSAKKRRLPRPGTIVMLLFLALLLQDDPVERYLAEKDKAARSRLLSEIKLPLPDVEAELRRPPKHDPAQSTGQIVRKKIRNQHALGAEFEVVLWVPQNYTPDK